jgi:hypothetical protein
VGILGNICLVYLMGSRKGVHVIGIRICRCFVKGLHVSASRICRCFVETSGLFSIGTPSRNCWEARVQLIEDVNVKLSVINIDQFLSLMGTVVVLSSILICFSYC